MSRPLRRAKLTKMAPKNGINDNSPGPPAGDSWRCLILCGGNRAVAGHKSRWRAKVGSCTLATIRWDGIKGQPQVTDDQSQMFQIFGNVGAPVFAVWIARHARRLGLRGLILRHEATRLDLRVTGQPDLLDAMALGCSLGPQEVWVDRIERLPDQARHRDDFSSNSD